MIKLTTQDLMDTSPKCIKPCPHYRPVLCESPCRLRMRTVFNCPRCHTVQCFYGNNDPLDCSGCNKQLPDIDAVLEAVDYEERVAFHLEPQL